MIHNKYITKAYLLQCKKNRYIRIKAEQKNVDGGEKVW